MNEEIKIKAKEAVNNIYQPLGHLRCMVSPDEMWEWAKSRAKEQIELLKTEIPMYVGEINPKWTLWNNVLDEINNL